MNIQQKARLALKTKNSKLAREVAQQVQAGNNYAVAAMKKMPKFSLPIVGGQVAKGADDLELAEVHGRIFNMAKAKKGAAYADVGITHEGFVRFNSSTNQLGAVNSIK